MHPGWEDLPPHGLRVPSILDRPWFFHGLIPSPPCPPFLLCKKFLFRSRHTVFGDRFRLFRFRPLLAFLSPNTPRRADGAIFLRPFFWRSVARGSLLSFFDNRYPVADMTCHAASPFGVFRCQFLRKRKGRSPPFPPSFAGYRTTCFFSFPAHQVPAGLTVSRFQTW